MRTYSNFVPRVAEHRRRRLNPCNYNASEDFDSKFIDNSYDPDCVVKAYKQRQNRIPESELEPMSEKYRAGASTYELAKEYGVHRSTISRTLKKAGITVSQKVTDREELTKKVLEMYANFMRPVDIGKEVGISESSVRRILHANDVRIRHSSEYK